MKIIRCKCGHLDYWDVSMWLHGGPWCRNCYKQKYKEETGREYIYDDLDDVAMPTEEMFDIQNMMNGE